MAKTNMMMKMTNIIKPDWPLPDFINAGTTTKQLSALEDKHILTNLLELPADPLWLKQIHTDNVIHSRDHMNSIEADACWTDEPNQICVVMTADCLPVLIADIKNHRIAAVHAGWRGLSKGIIQKTLSAMQADLNHTYAWIGPAISQACYETGPEVRAEFINQDITTTNYFTPSSKPDHFYADLPGIAKHWLNQLGIHKVYGGDMCTYTNTEQFFSYRRGKHTGRLASFIWFSEK